MYVSTDYPLPFEPLSVASIWILVLAFIIAFFLAFGVGANDVANSFGTSVGSKVLTLRQACILATIFEVLGAVSLGYEVSQTIRTGMIHIEAYKNQERLLMLGYLSALFGSSIWNMVATLFGLPISGTHSIVGAIIGFSLVCKGPSSVEWMGLVRIVSSWFISPLLSGVVSLVLFLLIRYFIISRENSLEQGLKSLPIFYGITILVNAFSIVHGPHLFKSITVWMALGISSAIGFVTGLIVWYIVVPKLRKKILKILSTIEENKKSIEENNSKIEMIAIDHVNQNGIDAKEDAIKNESKPISLNEKELKNEDKPKDVNLLVDQKLPENSQSVNSVEFDDDDDKPEVAKLFTFLQILTACFGSFAHGGNDVSNAIGPLVAVMMIFRDGDQTGDTPWYILLYGGVALSIGLWVWGRKVIETMGSDLTKITPSVGFTIEIGSAITVLLASKIGVPVSTTHCKVGSVVMVGKARNSKQGVNWRLFGNISAAWVLTVPATAIFSAIAMALLQYAE